MTPKIGAANALARGADLSDVSRAKTSSYEGAIVADCIEWITGAWANWKTAFLLGAAGATGVAPAHRHNLQPYAVRPSRREVGG